MSNAGGLSAREAEPLSQKGLDALERLVKVLFPGRAR